MELVAIAGMESIQQEFDNAYNLAAGFESIVAAGPSGSVDGFESTYASTVFTLNGISFDGQEGFLDSIKKGARKVYEWIKELIKTIRGWFTGSSKKEYDEAKKMIVEDLVLVKRVKELRDQGIDAHIKYDKDEGVMRIIKRMPPEVKKAVNEEIKKVDIPDVTTPEQLEEKITGTVVNDIASKVAGMIRSLNTRAAEVKRIDPDGSARDLLGIDHEWSFIVDSARNAEAHWTRENQTAFPKRAKAMVERSEEAQKELAKAVVALDHLNEKYKGHEHTDEGRQLSRCVAIVKLLTEIAAIYRDTIVSINSLSQKAIKGVEEGIIKDALRAAIANTDGATEEYIRQLMEAM
uniref:Virion structural protein n=1 Tax=Pantoea phage Survivor TaxID=3232176 RepID=A0AAU8L166_9CAUD